MTGGRHIMTGGRHRMTGGRHRMTEGCIASDSNLDETPLE